MSYCGIVYTDEEILFDNSTTKTPFPITKKSKGNEEATDGKGKNRLQPKTNWNRVFALPDLVESDIPFALSIATPESFLSDLGEPDILFSPPIAMPPFISRRGRTYFCLNGSNPEEIAKNLWNAVTETQEAIPEIKSGDKPNKKRKTKPKSHSFTHYKAKKAPL